MLRCPYIDQLARDLIEAYRRLDDTEVLKSSPFLRSRAVCDVHAIHDMLNQHRDKCNLCIQIRQTRRFMSPQVSVRAVA
jgi:hypothetical protein